MSAPLLPDPCIFVHHTALLLSRLLLLLCCRYGFNPGSTLAIIGNPAGNFAEGGYSQISAAVAVNTTVAAAAGTIACLFVAMAHTYFSLGVVVWDLIIAGNGALAGLVSITGGCHVVQTWGAIIIGAIGGLVYYIAAKVNLNLLKIDDPLDAIAVHAGCGIWGLIGTAAFAAQVRTLSAWLQLVCLQGHCAGLASPKQLPGPAHAAPAWLHSSCTACTGVMLLCSCGTLANTTTSLG